MAGLGQAWSGHPRLWREDCCSLKTWMPRDEPGQGLLKAKFGATRSPEPPFNFPRTALRFRGNDDRGRQLVETLPYSLLVGLLDAT